MVHSKRRRALDDSDDEDVPSRLAPSLRLPSPSSPLLLAQHVTGASSQHESAVAPALVNTTSVRAKIYAISIPTSASFDPYKYPAHRIRMAAPLCRQVTLTNLVHDISLSRLSEIIRGGNIQEIVLCQNLINKTAPIEAHIIFVTTSEAWNYYVFITPYIGELEIGKSLVGLKPWGFQGGSIAIDENIQPTLPDRATRALLMWNIPHGITLEYLESETENFFKHWSTDLLAIGQRRYYLESVKEYSDNSRLLVLASIQMAVSFRAFIRGRKDFAGTWIEHYADPCGEPEGQLKKKMESFGFHLAPPEEADSETGANSTGNESSENQSSKNGSSKKKSSEVQDLLMMDDIDDLSGYPAIMEENCTGKGVTIYALTELGEAVTVMEHGNDNQNMDSTMIENLHLHEALKTTKEKAKEKGVGIPTRPKFGNLLTIDDDDGDDEVPVPIRPKFEETLIRFSTDAETEVYEAVTKDIATAKKTKLGENKDSKTQESQESNENNGQHDLDNQMPKRSIGGPIVATRVEIASASSAAIGTNQGRSIENARAVLVWDLPADITLKKLFGRIQCGIIDRVFLETTRSLYSQALIVFVYPRDAHAFHTRVTDQGLGFNGKRARLAGLWHTRNFSEKPCDEQLLRDIGGREHYRRILVIRGIPPWLRESELVRDVSKVIQKHDRRPMTECIEGIVIREGEGIIKLAGIQLAVQVRNELVAVNQKAYAGVRFEFKLENHESKGTLNPNTSPASLAQQKCPPPHPGLSNSRNEFKSTANPIATSLRPSSSRFPVARLSRSSFPRPTRRGQSRQLKPVVQPTPGLFMRTASSNKASPTGGSLPDSADLVTVPLEGFVKDDQSVLMSCLPTNIAYAMLTPFLVGSIFKMIIYNQPPLDSGAQALITFVFAKDAQRLLERIVAGEVFICGKKAMAHAPYLPRVNSAINPAALAAIMENRASRCFQISGLPKHINKAKLVEDLRSLEYKTVKNRKLNSIIECVKFNEAASSALVSLSGVVVARLVVATFPDKSGYENVVFRFCKDPCRPYELEDLD